MIYCYFFYIFIQQIIYIIKYQYQSNHIKIYKIIIIKQYNTLSKMQAPYCILCKKQLNKFCMYSLCNQPAFICQQCIKIKCDDTHSHNGIFKFGFWSFIRKSAQNIADDINNVKLNNFIQTIQDIVAKIMIDLKNLLQKYKKRIDHIKKSRKLNIQFEQIMNRIKLGKQKQVKGKDMNLIYSFIFDYKYIENIQQLQIKRDVQISLAKEILFKITNMINSYIQMQQKIQINQIKYDPKDKTSLDSYNQKIKQKQLPDIYYSRGLLYQTYGQNDKAYMDYKKVIELNPKSIQAYNNLASIHYKKYQLNKALQQYNKAIQINPHVYYTYLNRGILYQNKNQLEFALHDFDKAIKYQPKCEQALYRRACLLLKLKEVNQALIDINQAIKINKINYKNYIVRGNIYEVLNQNYKAISDYSDAIEYNGKCEMAYKLRGLLYRYRLNNYEKGISDYKRFMQLSKKNSYFYRRRVNQTITNDI